MGLIDDVAKAASKVAEKKKKEKSEPIRDGETKSDRVHGYQWEKHDLQQARKYTEQGMEWDKQHSKTGWTNPQTGQKFPASHYAKNYELDKEALNRIKDEIKKKEKADVLKKAAMGNTKDTVSLRKRDKVDRYLAD